MVADQDASQQLSRIHDVDGSYQSVNNFRQGEITKLKALSNIISILEFNVSRTNQAKDAAIKYYAKTLDKVEALASSVVK